MSRMAELREMRGRARRILLALALASCGPPAGLATHPRRDIDQPYTLPADVNTWKTFARGGYSPVPEDAHGTTRSTPWVAPSPLPFGYEFSLGSKVTLEGFIIPIGLRAELFNDGTDVVGVRGLFFWHGYDAEGLFYESLVSVFHRRRAGSNWALESSVEAEAYRLGHQWVEDGELRRDVHARRTVSAGVGPRVQLTETLSLRPSLALTARRSPDATHVGVPLQANVGWRFHCRWHLTAATGVDLTELADDPAVVGNAALTWYW